MIDFSNLHLYHENNRIEAKQAQGGLPHSIWETYSAFANTMGGIILLGVMETEDKSFRSVPLGSPEWLADEFWSKINDGTHVNTNILSRGDIRIEESDGNRIVVIEVPRADRRDKPIFIGSDPYTGSYRRNGEGDYRCSRDEVDSMLRDKAETSPDTQLITELSLTDLNTETVIRYHAAFSALHSKAALAQLDFPEFLCQLGAAKKASDSSYHPTAGGLLMFGHYPDILRCFPGFSLRYCEEADPLSPSNNTSDKTTKCKTDTDFAAQSSFNLYEFYTYVCEKFDQIASFDTDNELLHQALREALVNALVHADYRSNSGTGLSITQTADNLLITNPGSFRVKVKEAINGRVSDPRNTALGTMFGLILPRGGGRRGLPAILGAWEGQGWPAPRIREDFDPDRITLVLPINRSHTAPDALTNTMPIRFALKNIPFSRSVREQQIAELLTIRPVCTLDEICLALHLSKSWVRKLLQRMLDKNLISSDNNRPDKKKQYRLTI